MMTGMEVFYQYLASLGDPDYSKFWNRAMEDPENTVIDSVGEGLEVISQTRAVLHVSETMLKRYYVEHSPPERIKVFGKGRPQFKTVIVTLNSPLKAIFTHGFRQVYIYTYVHTHAHI